MKNILFAIALLFLPLPSKGQRTLTTSQTAIRDEINLYMQSNGFTTEIDKNQNIKFDYEGSPMIVSVDSREEFPFYVSIMCTKPYNGSVTKSSIETDIAEMNLTKVAKVNCYDEVYVCNAGMYITEPDAFNQVLKRMLSNLLYLIQRINNKSNTQ